MQNDMEQIIDWGVIGSGGIARRRTIPEGLMRADNTRLISIYDIDDDVNNVVANEFGAIACNSIENLLESDIDAVYIASPAFAHFDHVVKCAKAKKNILCEKPLGMTTKETEQMMQICKEFGVLLRVGFMMPFQSQHQAALKLIQEGKLGKMVYGRAQLSCWYPPIKGAWRQDPALAGGGSLMDMGGHCIDLLEMYFGKVKEVSCFINNNLHDYSSEDSAVATLFFESGAIATVDTFFCIPDNSSKNMLELYGSKGSIIAKNTIGQGESGEMVAFIKDDYSGYDAGQSREANNGFVIKPEPINTYLSEIHEFNTLIRENKSQLDENRGLRNQLVLTACYEAAKTKKVISVNYT